MTENKHEPGSGGSGKGIYSGSGNWSMGVPTSLAEARCEIVVLRHRLACVEERLDALEEGTGKKGKPS